jgi:hypothetical protein
MYFPIWLRRCAPLSSCVSFMCGWPVAILPARRRDARNLPPVLSVFLMALWGLTALDAAAQAPTTEVGSTSPTQTATITITTSGTLNSIAVLTQGAPGLDFKIVQPNSAATPCTVGTDYEAGDDCTVQYTFTPLSPGVRAGGVRLTSSSATLATAFLTGSGTGPMVTFRPEINSSINTFSSIYFSSYADDYLSPGTYRVIEKIPVGCTSASCFQTVTSSVNGPTLLALDGLGNLYVYDDPDVKRIPPGCTSSGCMSIVGGGFQGLSGLAVDSTGNVYVSDQEARSVYQVPPGCASSNCTVSLGGGSWQYPTGVAVDGAGNVYVADGRTPQGAPFYDQGQLHVMPPNCANAGCVTNLSNAFGSLGNIAVDGVGNLYALDTALGGNFGAGGVDELPAACRSCMVLIGSGYRDPAQTAGNGNGTVYVADNGNHQIAEIDLTTPATVDFASTVAGQTSAAETVTLTNNGNAPLIFAIPGTGNNPGVSANFSISNSSTCPLLNSSSLDTASLAAGSSCSQLLSFVPTTPGPITGSSTVTDNNLNASDATQSIPLSGTGTESTPSVNVDSPSVSVNAASVTLQASISTAGVPSSGAVAFSVNGGSAIAATCTGSNSPILCAATYNPSGLTAGSYSIVATIAADINYASTSGNATLTITQGMPTLSLSSSGSTSKVNDVVTFTASVSPASGITPTGKVSFGTTLNGTTSAIPGCTSVSLVRVTGPRPSLKATCTTNALMAGSNSITASLASDSNFDAGSNSIGQTVSKATPSLSVSPLSGSSTINNAVTFVAAATPSTGIVPTGSVSFSTTLNGTTSPVTGCTSIPLSALSASCTTSALGVGSNAITATIASDSNFNSSTSNSVTETVTAGPLAKFLVPGGTVVAGANNLLSITAQDAYGNTVTSFNGTVNLSFTGSATVLLPNPVGFSNGVASVNYTFRATGAQSISASDTANSAITGSGNFTVLPGAIHSFAISTSATAVTGTSISLTVNGADLSGNLATNYTGTVHFTSSDPLATLPADTTLTNGTGTFHAVFRTPGAQTITATDALDSTVTGTSQTVAVSTLNLIVTNLNDDAGNASNCSNQAAGSVGTDGACSLRDAAFVANNAGTADISFAPVLTASASTDSPAVVLFGYGELDLSGRITLNGPGANLMQINAQGQSSVVNVNSTGAAVAISGLTFTGGRSTHTSPIESGGISNQGTLTLTGVVITGNTAAYGGGILQTAGTLTMIGSTVSGNSATQAGGGIDVKGGSLIIQDSTIANNTSTGPGAGGIHVEAGSSITLTSTTVTGNTAASAGGGLSVAASTTTIGNSIVAGNSAPGSADLQGTFADYGGNLIAGAGVSAGTSPQLSPLGNYGGNTQSMVPLPGSPALCAGTAGNDANIPLDQRGYLRTAVYGSNTCYDAGSVQSRYALAFVQQPTAIVAGQAITPSPTVQVEEQGLPFSQSGIALDVTPTAGTLIGTSSQTTGVTGLATFNGLSVASAESAEALTANLTLSSAITLSTVSTAFDVATPPPTVTFTSPTSGPATGGTAVTLTGTHFANTSMVKFGTTSASFTVDSSTQITATSPAGAVNTVDVTVTAPGGTSAVSTSDQFTYVLATKTINFTPPASPVSVGNTATLTATASNGDPVTFTVTSGTASLQTVSGITSITYTNAGSVTVTANSAANGIYAAATPVSYTVSIDQTAQTISFPQPLSPLTYSAGLKTTLTASATSGLAVRYQVLSGPASVSGAILSYTAPGTVVVEADQPGDSIYSAATPMQRTIVLNAMPTIAFTIPNQTYGEASFQVKATSNSPGAFTYTLTSGNATVTPGGLVTLTGVGTVTIGVEQAASGNFTSSIGAATFTVGKGTATITPGNLTQTYTGFPLPVTANTNPAGLNVSITYAGSSTAPTAAGSYPIVATIVDSNYTGASTGTLVISKATATVVLSNLSQTYTGSPSPVTATTNPAGLNVSITYAGSSTAPTAAGSYAVVATIGDSNYSGNTAGTLLISNASATISLDNLTQTYTGLPLPITATSNPAALAINIAYAGSPIAPTAAGTYGITATIADSNYSGAATGTLLIQKAAVAVSLVPTSASAPYGSDERLTIAVTQAGAASAHGATPTGTVTLIIGGASTTIALTNGDATYDAGILPAGPYIVTANYTGNTDYTGVVAGSSVTPLFTISSGALLVIADNATRVYGTLNPTFTGNVSGQQSGDTFTETFLTTAIPTSPVGNYLIVPQVTGANLANYTVSARNGTLSVTPAGTSTTAIVSANSITTLQTLTVTANVLSSTTGTPTGSVQLLDGTSVIATTQLNGTTASFSLSNLAVGSHSLSVAYLGDTNFTGSSTTATLPVTVNVADFVFTSTNGTQSQTIIPGQTAHYTFQISPEPPGYPGIVTFTVSGLPPGATAVFTPNNIPVNGGPQTVTLSITTASISAAVERPLPPGRRAPILLGILLLPLAGVGRIRRRRLGRVLNILLLFAGSIATLAVLTGCGSGNGYFGQKQQSYNVTVTATSGPAVHTENVTLTLE